MKKLSGWKRLWIICSLFLFVPVSVFLFHNISLVSSEAIRIKYFAEAAIECKQQPVDMMIYGYTEGMHIPQSKIVDQIKKDCGKKVNFDSIEKKANKEASSQFIHNIISYLICLLGAFFVCVAITGAFIGIMRWIILGFSPAK